MTVIDVERSPQVTDMNGRIINFRCGEHGLQAPVCDRQWGWPACPECVAQRDALK